MAEAKRLDTTEKARLFSMMLEKKLKCPVCLKQLNPQHHPQKFPDCGHICCNDCFQKIVENNPEGEVRCPQCNKIWTTFGAYKESKMEKPKRYLEGNKSMNRFSYIAQDDDADADDDNDESDSNNNKTSSDKEISNSQSSDEESSSPRLLNISDQDSEGATSDSDAETKSAATVEPNNFQSRRRMLENGIVSRGSVQAKRNQLAPLKLDRNRAKSMQAHRVKKSPLKEQSGLPHFGRQTYSAQAQLDGSNKEHADRMYKGRPERTKEAQLGKFTDEDKHSRQQISKSSHRPLDAVAFKPSKPRTTSEDPGLSQKPRQTQEKLSKSYPAPPSNKQHFVTQPLNRDKDHQRQPKLGPSVPEFAFQGKQPQTSVKKQQLPRTDLTRKAPSGATGPSHGNQLSDKAIQLNPKLPPIRGCKTRLHLKFAQKFGDFQCAMSIASSDKDWLVVTDFDGNAVTTFQKQRTGSYKKHKTLNLNTSNPYKPVDVAVTRDGNILVTRQTCIEIYSSSGKLTRTITSKNIDPELSSVLALSDGTILAGDIAKSVITEHDPSGKFRRTIKLPVKPYNMTSLQDMHIAISDPESDTISIVDLKSGQEAFRIPIPKVQGICYCKATGGILAVRSSYKSNKRGEERVRPGTGVIEQYCPAKGTWVQDLEEGLHYPSDLCFTPDDMLAVADKNKVVLYDVSWHT